MLTGRRFGGSFEDGAAVEANVAAVGMLEAGEEPQQGGLAAARGAKQRKEFAGRDRQRDVVESPDASGERSWSRRRPRTARSWTAGAGTARAAQVVGGQGGGAEVGTSPRALNRLRLQRAPAPAAAGRTAGRQEQADEEPADVRLPRHGLLR